MSVDANRTVEEVTTTKLTITLYQGYEGYWFGEVDGRMVVATLDRADAADVLADYLLGAPSG